MRRCSRSARRSCPSALALPEFTRTMRGLGSRRGHPGADHDRFFAGSSLRGAPRKGSPSRSRAWPRSIRSVSQTAPRRCSASWPPSAIPESAPDRRALEAELLEHAERLHAALDALGEAAEQVRTSATRGSARALARLDAGGLRVFEEADRSLDRDACPR